MAALESPGQRHPHAWGPGGGPAKGLLLLPVVSGPLFQGLSSRGIRLLTEWLRVAQGAMSTQRQEVEAASLSYGTASAIFCWPELPQSPPRLQGGDQTPPLDQNL